MSTRIAFCLSFLLILLSLAAPPLFAGKHDLDPNAAVHYERAAKFIVHMPESFWNRYGGVHNPQSELEIRKIREWIVHNQRTFLELERALKIERCNFSSEERILGDPMSYMTHFKWLLLARGKQFERAGDPSLAARDYLWILRLAHDTSRIGFISSFSRGVETANHGLCSLSSLLSRWPAEKELALEIEYSLTRLPRPLLDLSGCLLGTSQRYIAQSLQAAQEIKQARERGVIISEEDKRGAIEMGAKIDMSEECVRNSWRASWWIEGTKKIEQHIARARRALEKPFPGSREAIAALDREAAKSSTHGAVRDIFGYGQLGISHFSRLLNGLTVRLDLLRARIRVRSSRSPGNDPLTGKPFHTVTTDQGVRIESDFRDHEGHRINDSWCFFGCDHNR